MLEVKNLLQSLQIFEVHCCVEQTNERVHKLKYYQLDSYVGIMLFLGSRYTQELRQGLQNT